MADKKITELNNITGANLVDADEFVVVDISADETKAITRAELFKNTPNIGIGTNAPSGGLHISDTFPTLTLDETNTDAGYQQTQLAIDDGSFRIQTRDSTNTFVSNDYLIDKDAAGGAAHIWRIGNIERMRIDASGNVGIGGSTPDVALDVVGDINYTGTITDVSDRRLKENVQNLSGSLGKICQLNAKSYTLIADRDNENTEIELGFIAQEVQPVFPEIVKEVQKFAVDENGELTDQEANYLGVSYIQLIAPMVEAIKELKAKNDALEARIIALGG